MTVFSEDQKRFSDAEAYANQMGVDWLRLGFTESLGDITSDLLSDKISLYISNIEFFEVLPENSWYLPMGIQNEGHHQVCDLLTEYLHGETVHRYLEIPYYVKKKNSEELHDYIQDRTIHSILPGDGHKGHERFYKCFKHQQKFFFYNPPESFQKIPEIILNE
jgi:hypothetical protein